MDFWWFDKHQENTVNDIDMNIELGLSSAARSTSYTDQNINPIPNPIFDRSVTQINHARVEAFNPVNLNIGEENIGIPLMSGLVNDNVKNTFDTYEDINSVVFNRIKSNLNNNLQNYIQSRSGTNGMVQDNGRINDGGNNFTPNQGGILNGNQPAMPNPNGHVYIEVPVRRANGRHRNSSKPNNGGERRPKYNDPNRRCTNANCRTNDTPMWRRGPLGPMSLCNACGLKYRKEEMKRNARGGEAGSSSGGKE